MKGILKLENGKELTIELDNEILKYLEEPKKTGYERVCAGEEYYTAFHGKVVSFHEMAVEEGGICSLKDYEDANYYSDKAIAKNNARADLLMRKLRRFAVEHRTKELDWNDSYEEKRCIAYDHETKQLMNAFNQTYQAFGKIYFDSKETAEAAIEEFHDELLWYFTEYKDSL